WWRGVGRRGRPRRRGWWRRGCLLAGVGLEAEQRAQLRIDGVRHRDRILALLRVDEAREPAEPVGGDLEPEPGARLIERGERVASGEEAPEARRAIPRLPVAKGPPREHAHTLPTRGD